ncbi:MAG: hypothetical protein H6977_12575 [Gammaproteobacteria bacterium]|nr:hypothetical protein [Gammaproteobacteria bacterium]MCP5200842.1 hypothetical protein [Gammaproteobacteria bacterium]
MKGLAWHWLALWALTMAVICQPLGDFALFGVRYYRFGFVEVCGRGVAAIALLFGMVRYAGLTWPVAVNRFARLVALVLLTWEGALNADIAYLSARAHRLCSEEGGIHIAGTAEVEGFLWMAAGIEEWAAAGYSYLEEIRRDSAGNRIVRRARMVDGEPVFSVIAVPSSLYEVQLVWEVVGYRVERREVQVRNRETAAILGRYVAFEMRPGWFDELILRFLPHGHAAYWTCGNEVPSEVGDGADHDRTRVLGTGEFIRLVLKPRRH